MQVPKIEIVHPSFEIMTPVAEIAQYPCRLELAGRTCYRSEGKIEEGSADKLIRKVIKRGHESVLEHCSITVRYVMDRTASHQLVRHRLAAYCLSGDTQIVALRSLGSVGSSPKRWLLKQLYEWQGDPKRKGRIGLIRVRCVDGNGVLVQNKIKRIFKTGKQEVFLVSTRCGRSVKATINHRFMTPSGWSKLSELSVGDCVVANGIPAIENPEWIREMYLVRNMKRVDVAKLAGISDSALGKKIAEFGLQKSRKMYPNRQPGHGVPGMFSEDSKKKISQRMFGEGNHSWKGDDALSGAGYLRAWRKFDVSDCVCSCCSCSDSSLLERHHIDKNPLNNDDENVLILCQKCHKAHHIGSAVRTVYSSPIVSIISAGFEDTYDMEMVGEPHNFVANGIVVHNSQESQRFCNYGKSGALRVIIPEALLSGMGANEFLSEGVVISDVSELDVDRVFSRFLQSCLNSYGDYLYFLEAGLRPEDARLVLPGATATMIVTTFNLRQWRHFFDMRCDEHAQRQIRMLALGTLRSFAGIIPSVFKDKVEKYLVRKDGDDA